MKALTESTIAKLRVPPGKPDVTLFDPMLPGFFVRRFKSGRTSFGIKYVIAGKQMYLTIGEALPGKLKERRSEASDMLVKARKGVDPASERKEAHTPKAAEPTLGKLIEQYLPTKRGKLRPRTYTQTVQQLQRYFKPLHDRPLRTIKLTDVSSVIDDLVKERGPVAADRSRSALSAFYTWAMRHGYAETSPVANIEPRAQNGSRERVLTEAELAIVWKACGKGDYGRIIRLLILTGQRRSEIADLSWSEIDLAKCEITLPGRRTKNKRLHIVPLSPEAIALLPEPTEGREFLFGRGRGGFSGWTRAKSELEASIIAVSGQPLAPWTLHDLRRSFVTHLAERKIATPWVIEALVNHISGSKGGIAGIYNRALHADEKRLAMLTWGKHVGSLVNQ